VDAYGIDEFVNCVKYLAPSFGGINLEDIKGPECFEIESRLKKLMNIPVFHDDQHGTAIICLAGLINAVHSSGKKFEDLKIVCNGAGAAGIACVRLIESYGAKKENCLMVDTKGVIYKGR
jgi:malate dehydrogenase (oxaloacetate-decarboxylating)(NADP+)